MLHLCLLNRRIPAAKWFIWWEQLPPFKKAGKKRRCSGACPLTPSYFLIFEAEGEPFIRAQNEEPGAPLVSLILLQTSYATVGKSLRSVVSEVASNFQRTWGPAAPGFLFFFLIWDWAEVAVGSIRTLRQPKWDATFQNTVLFCASVSPLIKQGWCYCTSLLTGTVRLVCTKHTVLVS